MKKIARYILLVLIIGEGLLMTGCISADSDPITKISNEIELDVSAGELIFQFETEHRWMGDGVAYFEISFTDIQSDSIIDEIMLLSSWKELPTSNNLNIALYGDSTRNSLFADEDEIPELPIINHGYYYFNNRHSEADESENESTIFGRYSYNFTVALFDLDTNKMHYLTIDT